MSEVVRIEKRVPDIARVIMNRPERGNAQNNQLLYALDAALVELARDPTVRVIILAGEGKHFSSGHDLGEFDPRLQGVETVGVWGGFEMPAMEGYMAFEEEAYFGLCWRWRNIPKPLIAEVQGRVIAAGLMLAWICDLIVASEDAIFTDPVVAAGVNGVEYFAHPWEVGVRKAKEMLFTGQGITAQLAERLGMVNRVVPRERLTAATFELAQIIAQKPPMGVRLAKLAVNQAQDEQGFYNSLRGAMGLQHLAHAQAWALHGAPADPDAADRLRQALKSPNLT
jgi:enoyl-CoA hydratase